MTIPAPRPILLVEDSRRDAELLQDALEEQLVHIPFVHVRDGVAALVWLDDQMKAPEPRLPALILLDLKMPRMTGMELLAHLKRDERWRRIPVVLMTSSSQESDLAAAYALGVNAYVLKPLEFEAFLHTVRQVVTFWTTMNLLPELETS